MNITKRMLQYAAAVVAVAIGGHALAAGLTLPYAESFESESYTDGYAATNLTDWASTSEDDASVITNMTYAFEPAGEGITYPIGISGTTHLKVLKLNTEGGTLSAMLDDTATDFETQSIYVDTMINFVISEDDPSFAGMDDVKIAVFANAASNLVIRHGMYDEELAITITNSVTDVVVDPAKWYRLTITIKQQAINGTPFSLFKVSLNGADPIIHVNARDGDVWFDASQDANDSTDYSKLTAVSFQGTGYIDDLVVTRDNPFGPAGFFDVYTVVGANGSINGDAHQDVAPGDDLTIVYTADEWYRIDALEVDGVPVSAAAGEATYTQVLTDVQGDISNNVSFVQATQGQTGLGVPNAWAAGFGYTEAQALADLNIADDYLLGLDPTGTYAIGFDISALDVDGNVTVTCTLTDGAVPLDTTINGSLKVYGKVELTDATWTEIGAATALGIEDFVNGEAVLGPFDAGTYNFFKAVIE